MKIKLHIKSLGFRLALLYSFLFFLTILTIFAVIHFILAHKLLQNIDKDIKEDVSDITILYNRKGIGALKNLALEEIKEEGPNNYFFRIIDSKNKEIFSVGSSTFKKLPWPNIASKEPKFLLWSTVPPFGKVRGVIWRIGDGEYSIEMAITLRSYQEILSHIHESFLWAGVMGLVISFPMGFFFSKRSLKQLLDMEKTVRSIIKTRNFSQQIPISGKGDEPDQLAETFNSLLSQLDIYLQELLKILDRLAHDFKNLLSHLRLLAERALEKDIPEEREELIVRILYESDRFLHLLNIILDLSEAETGLLKLKQEQVPVKDILREVEQVFHELAISQNLNFKVSYPNEDSFIFIDRSKFLQSLLNLVDNAFKYTSPGGFIQIETQKEEKNFIIKIQDSGRGIPKGELDKIFGRFYRGRCSKNGRGLGLSLAKAYVEAHGGKINVESEPGKGSIFYIILPQSPNNHNS